MRTKKLNKNKKYFKLYDGGGSLLGAGVSAVNKLYNPKNNSTIAGNVMQGLGSVASNIPGIGGIIGAGVQAVGGLVNAAFGNNINEDAVDNYQMLAEQQASYMPSASDNMGLISDWNNITELGEVTKDDIGSEGWFSNKASDKAEYLTEMNRKANMKAWNAFQNASDNLSRQKSLMEEANYIAMGGPLDSNFNNGVVFINTGGTHEENPNGGVPMGLDSQGVPNLVEEGEVIWDDYVFSDRIKATKKALSDAKLPEKYEGKTLAGIAELIQKESSERPNDPISKNGLNKNMNKLISVSEGLRNRKSKNSNRFDDGGPKQSYLRYAPIVASGISVLNDWLGGNDPDYANADLYQESIKNYYKPISFTPIGDYMEYNPIDTEFYTSKIQRNAAATRNALMNNSGGNRAAANAGIIASDYMFNENIGDLALKAAEYNQAQREKVKTYNQGINRYNSEMGYRANAFNSELASKQADRYRDLALMRQNIRDAKETEHSSNLTNFIQNIADLGTEISDANTLQWLLENGVLKGRACGGKIKRKRRFTV